MRREVRAHRLSIPLSQMNVRIQRRQGAELEQGVEISHRLAQLHGALGDMSAKGGGDAGAGNFQQHLLDLRFEFFNAVAEFALLGISRTLVVKQVIEAVADLSYHLFADQTFLTGGFLTIQFLVRVFDLDRALLDANFGSFLL